MNPPQAPADLDARVRFYLEHREQIETWHRLRGDAIRFCSDTLSDLVPFLTDVAESQQLQLRDARTGRWRILSIAAADAPLADDGIPLAAVTVSWADEVVLDDPDLAPYVGIRVAMGDPRGSVLRDTIGDATRAERKARGASKDRWWPIWERVVAPSGWWDDPSVYLEKLTGIADDYVRSFSSTIAAPNEPQP